MSYKTDLTKPIKPPKRHKKPTGAPDDTEITENDDEDVNGDETEGEPTQD